MSELSDEVQAWLRTELDNSVQGLIDAGAFDDALIEVKPAWILPSRLLLGRARGMGDTTRFRWFICGEVPLDHMPGDNAATPREAIRYFAMKWQMDAEKQEADGARETVDHAESLYALSDDERFWQ